MRLFEIIKGEKKLAFTHWRYRLLHFTFNVNATNAEEAVQKGMREFFYTHYCPLFHLTNLLALIFPLIILFRFLVRAALFLSPVGDYIFGLYQYPESKNSLEKDRINFVKFVKTRYYNHTHIKDFSEWFDFFFDIFKGQNNNLILTRDDAKILFDETVIRLKHLQETLDSKKQIRREKLIFWIRFSEVFIKGLITCLYVAVPLIVLYALYWIIPLLLTWKVVIKIGISTIIFLVSTLFVLVALLLGRIGVLEAIFNKLFTTLGCIVDFFSMFYEENCPPIKIVSPEEAVIEEDS